ncbi:MAG TPA: 2-amino-4-hydroxy-6-hydroxymethyldihydropteridine diphosphokinase [Candidatus Anaerobutyricum stercoris]|uniref:Bifunctional folate synthesis protein n=1 Tax=Candidatus Anaerobutyricum stercoris TaxID=2838457 RepID=A0A9D2EKC7_9FIRM|nr:2-amino-4-hydroxy-6-hydroxymethyldihydropteridine diphosphokinase [Eubacterium sp. An3]OUO29547.1 2-amino-4-hydroxy-6-hydroxymethyldihydropteridine pyrophosphokinase [Eubacterium sp. An3]CVI67769.1 Bifunctional folate synthesis protein [Eubacteriaceae bacterium CHKCI004]HIZ39299.1 2-amino-4-hydroxy-6-hydroxymethyldihydropteridine diphosphokinase [Candidatus Anaerobutyricum stercoris]
MDKITIKNLEVFCNHGVYKEENILGQKFLVSAELSLSTRKAGLSDALEDSVSYGDVSRLITAEMKKQNDKLLERAAERIAGQILKEFPLIDSVRIEVKKPWAPVMMHLDYASVSIERGWHRVYVGVGSNMGERQAWIDMAAEALRSDGNNRNFRSAQVIETEPYGYLEQDKFLNTVFTFETLYEPEELLLRMQEIEKEAHRERKIHWGPRTLDLDLLLYDNRITESPVLTIPHPEMTKRLFVLIPLCELNPHGVHPLYRKRFAEYKEALEQQENK